MCVSLINESSPKFCFQFAFLLLMYLLQYNHAFKVIFEKLLPISSSRRFSSYEVFPEAPDQVAFHCSDKILWSKESLGGSSLFCFRITVHHQGSQVRKSRQKPEGRIWSRGHGGFYQLASSNICYITPDDLCRSYTTHRRLSPPPSVSSQENPHRPAHTNLKETAPRMRLFLPRCV